MTIPIIPPLPKFECFTAWVTDFGINCLVRSADWYAVPPIKRYLYNVAARDIRMEDCRTELRAYTFDDFEVMRQLLERADEFPAECALEAWILWVSLGDTFGVVHVEKDGPNRGDRLIGDDPQDLKHFIGIEEYGKVLAKNAAFMVNFEGKES